MMMQPIIGLSTLAPYMYTTVDRDCLQSHVKDVHDVIAAGLAGNTGGSAVASENLQAS